jgi:D-glycero-D-manno-heptose 1,7-bisphosphate phosphatase
MKPINKAVFLDRDGVINEEKGYLHRIEDFVFIPGAPEAIARLKDSGYLVVVVTNQSGVARGYFSLDDVNRLHEYIDTELAARNTSIDAYRICTHHPDFRADSSGAECSCRKPLPGMIEAAAADLSVDLARSWLVGDKLTDIQAGLAAGCRSILVLTGYGRAESSSAPCGVPVAADLGEAVRLILQSDGGL